MEKAPRITFKNLKSNIADAIKKSCYSTDARLYNIAGDVLKIPTYSADPEIDYSEGLTKITDITIKESVALDCDLSVISAGILLGTFRSSPSMPKEAHRIIRMVIKEIFHPVYKYKGNIKQVIEGILATISTIADEYKIEESETLTVAREGMLHTSKLIDPKFFDVIKEILP